jgi:hypothetical protein
MQEIDEKVEALTFGQIDKPHSLEKIWKSQYRTQLIQDYYIEGQRTATLTMKWLTVVVLVITLIQGIIAYLIYERSDTSVARPQSSEYRLPNK